MGKSKIDLGIEWNILTVDVFLDIDEDKVDRLEVANTKLYEVGEDGIFSSKENGFLGTIGDLLEKLEIELLSMLGNLELLDSSKSTLKVQMQQ